jgi:AcrR family transcriptional regulator
LAGGRASVKQPTQLRVLEMSAELFNRYGVEAVSVNQISEALSISPGNLTYHYEKKSHLLAEHMGRFEKLLLERMERFPLVSNAKTFSEAYVELLSLTLRYRFLFLGANYIVQNELLKPERYQKLVTTIKRSFARQIKRLVADGYMTPIKEPYTIDIFVDSIWWQWLGWLMSMQILPPVKKVPEPRLLADAVLHILFLNHHYANQDFFRAVQTELKRLGRKKPGG